MENKIDYNRLRDKLVYWWVQYIAKPILLLLFGIKKGCIKSDNTHISFYTMGKGEPLFLLYGFTANKDSWLLLAAILKKNFKLILIDFAGHGDSDIHLNQSFTIKQQAKHLLALYDHLNIDKAHIWGHSMGGGIASAFSYLHPDRVKSLCLMASLGAGKDHIGKDMVRIIDDKLLNVESDEDFDVLFPLLTGAKAKVPWIFKSITRHDYKINSDLYGNILSQILIAEYSEQQKLYPKISANTLIIWGEEDHVLNISGAHIINELIPHSTLVTLPTGHCPNFEMQDEVVQSYLNFIEELPK